MEWKCRICGEDIKDSDVPFLCKEHIKDNKDINEFIEQGHTHHCACRLVWGDGECECNRSSISRKEQAEKLIEVIKNEVVKSKSCL